MMRTKDTTRIYAFGTGLIGFIIILVYLSTDNVKKEPLRPGMMIPRIEYLSEEGLQQLAPRSGRYQLIILFNKNCRVCTRQLDAFNEEDTLNQMIDILFITTDVGFLVNKGAQNWKNLSSKDQIEFGIIKRRRFLNKFGSLITPSYYLFGQNGKLIWQAKGKVPLAQINMILLRSISH